MNRARLTIGILLLSTSCMLGQVSTPLSTPTEVMERFYSALASENDSTRNAELKTLFIEGGSIHATLQSNQQTSRTQLGSVDAFLKNSAPFYAANKLDYQEVERNIDYYQDLLHVQSVALQRIEDKQTKEEFEQWLWISLDMAYQNERWYITAASWVNSIKGYPIRRAILQDTLWHKPEH